MPKLLLVGLGGFFGASLRYLLSGLAHRWFSASFPSGTLAVNVLGCFIMGIMVYLAEDRQLLGTETRVLLMVGFLGSFTTFSSFEYETFEMFREGQPWVAAWNMGLNVLLGISAVMAGWMSMRLIRF